MRAVVISDTDGSVEYQKVKLEPQNWCVFTCSLFSLPCAEPNTQGLVGQEEGGFWPERRHSGDLDFQDWSSPEG
jgi:hypothetical protein